VGCAGTGFCAATGVYVDSSSHTQAVVVNRSGGHWAQAREVRLPAGAPADPFGDASSAGCTGVGSCVAVGFYQVSGQFQGFEATESHGAWGRARLLIPPANAAAPSNFQGVDVTCTGAGACVAIGDYQDNAGGFQTFVATESNGAWHPGIQIHMPSNAKANPLAFFFSVSCAQRGSCAASGEYADNSGHTEPAVATESGGKWRRAIEIKPPLGAAANPRASVRSVACNGAGSCIGVGTYTDNHGAARSFTVTESAGNWRRAVKFTKVPSDAKPLPHLALSGVSCIKGGSCIAVGTYLNKLGGTASLAAVSRGGKWIAVSKLSAPLNSQGGAGLLSLIHSVSCTKAAFCAAVGNYRNKVGRFLPMGSTTS